MKAYKLFSLLLVATVCLTACGPTAAPAVPTAPSTRPATTQPPSPPTSQPTVIRDSQAPDAALSARQILAQQLHIRHDAITIVSAEKVEWPDGCLGISIEGISCIQVVTPGYEVVLEVNGRRYEYHTDETGGRVMLASAPEPDIEDAAIAWTQDAGGPCQTAIIGSQEVAFGLCGAPQMTAEFAPGMEEMRAEDFAYFVETYAPFESETPAGKVTFSGTGSGIATEAERRMIAEWARLVTQEAAFGRSGASWGLAFAWHREGGIAGFCDDLSVYVTGHVFASSCKGDSQTDLGRARLTAEQLKQLFAWVDGLKGFEFEQTDPATADALTIRVVFSGTGSAEATDADRQAIQDFAAELFAELGK